LKDENELTYKKRGKCLTDATSEELEEDLLTSVGMIRDKDYTITDIPVDAGHIHTIECGHNSLPPLLLIHGYGSGAIFYFKLLSQLKQRFHVYAIDLFGMGSSSRPLIKDSGFENVISFFVDTLEHWRVKVGLEKFALMAHSMGAYISTHWVQMYNPSIEMLYLLSPAGFTNKDPETELEGQKTFFMKGAFFQLYNLIVQKLKLNPLPFLPMGPRTAIRHYFKNRKLDMTAEQKDLLCNYFITNLDKPESGERALGVLLKFGRYSEHPICDILVSLRKSRGYSMPIVLLYGEKDWMDWEHSLLKAQELSLGLEIKFIPDSDHQILLQNSQALCDLLISDLDKGYGLIHKEILEKHNLWEASHPQNSLHTTGGICDDHKTNQTTMDNSRLSI